MLFIFISLGSIIFIFRETILDKYQKFNKLYSIVSLNNNNNKFITLYHTISIIYTSIKISILKYRMFNNNVKKIDKNLWEVVYNINGKKYKMIVIPNKGPSDIVKISDENGVDISNYISHYLGPNNDFHKTEILTPEFFNVKSIIIEKNDGTIQRFSNKEILKICY